MVTIHAERTIDAAADRVFNWLADPASLVSSPVLFSARWTTAVDPRVGALRTAVGFGIWVREEITAYDPPRSYSYRIVRSFPAFEHDGGTLTLTPAGEATHVNWSSTYTHPAMAGGKAFEHISAPLLRLTFNAVLAGCAKALEG